MRLEGAPLRESSPARGDVASGSAGRDAGEDLCSCWRVSVVAQAQGRVEAACTAKLRALERERALDAQLLKEREEEAARLARLQEALKQMEETKADKAEQLKVQEQQRRTAALDRAQAQRDLAHLQAEGKRLVEEERLRLEREKRFKDAHVRGMKSMEECLEAQEGVRKRLDAVTLPVRDVQNYLDNAHIFKDAGMRATSGCSRSLLCCSG